MNLLRHFIWRFSYKSVHDKNFRLTLYYVFMKKSKNLGQNEKPFCCILLILMSHKIKFMTLTKEH